MVGKIQKFDELRGYGFIMIGFRKKIFFHVTEWRSDIAPKLGQAVTFDLVPARKAGFEHQAANVTPVETGLTENENDLFVLVMNDGLANVKSGGGQ